MASQMKVSVIGLGKLGLPLTASIASKGFEVVGVDINKEVVDKLTSGETIINEPGLSALIREYKENIKATLDVKDAILNSEITFIITPTPSQKNGYFSTKYLKDAILEIGKSLRLKSSYHLVVVVSTIMPESMEEIKDLLEKTSGKKCSEDFGLCYNPEFIALGSVIYNLLNPDLILIGESDKKAGDVLEVFYKEYLDNKPPFARMNFVNAELTKISINTYITTKISYANMLAEICEKLPGGNVDVVTSALGLDTRIGSKYLKGGTSFGGPCFPRDNVAFISLARNLKTNYDISLATHKTNLKQVERLAEKVLQYAKGQTKVGILGIAYKPFTDVIEMSTGLLLAQLLIKRKIELNLHDPISLENTKKVLGKNANYVNDLKRCIENSDVIVITTNWPDYLQLKSEWFKEVKVIIDPWRMLDLNQLPKTLKYIPLGLNLNPE